ncbi:phosphonoacetate hydrolase [Colwellia chukchiensis]|uniref:Phosphonoacetate hydrolase n=1 Tax=Colwellia chukchiensis TaxID=641665 RepID=A0A1H7Q939_9GAMM|nr:zinc ribbon domain-containing protein YjdM [Colwellia chukchiensis]SEL44248.1 phosphonoacetate hydrolase [Colwellia chukchiensis]
MPLPPCPKCHSNYIYQDLNLLICPECAHEWQPSNAQDEVAETQVKDANGTILNVGDKVTMIKDLKIKASSQVIKVGTKAIIKRISTGKDHQLDCKVAGVGEMMITAKFVKSARLT